MSRRGIKIAYEKFLVFTLFSFFLLFYCKLGSSDEVSNSRINLSEAIKIFKEKNYDVKIAAYEIKKSEGAYIQAGLLLNPALSINYTGLSVGGKNLIYDTDNTLLSVRFEQPLELGGKRRLRRLSAFYQLRAVDFQTKEISRELVVGLITSYFRALADRLYAEYLQRDIDDFDEILKIQEKRQKEGFLSLIDFMKLQLYKLELESALIQAVSTYKKSLKDFNFFLGGGNYEPEEVQEPQDEIFVENLIQDSVPASWM
jgi:cobalt-zinc-cadmium efflux system outer membrane protein